eukprot:6190645-Pleurochrysis_carterae.AAC.1
MQCFRNCAPLLCKVPFVIWISCVILPKSCVCASHDGRARASQDHFAQTYKQTIGLDFFIKRLVLPGQARALDFVPEQRRLKQESKQSERGMRSLVTSPVSGEDWVCLQVERTGCISSILHCAV